MNGEPILFLKLSANHMAEADAVSGASTVIEEFLDQLDGDLQRDVLARLLDGDALVVKHGEETGRELAAYRLVKLLPSIGAAANALSETHVDNPDAPGTQTSTDVELSNAAHPKNISK